MGAIAVSALILNASLDAHGGVKAALTTVGLVLLLSDLAAPVWTERDRGSSKLYVATISSYLVCLGLFLAAVKTGAFWTWPFGIAGCVMFVVAHLVATRWRQSYRRSPLLRPHHGVTEAFKRPPGGRKAA